MRVRLWMMTTPADDEDPLLTATPAEKEEENEHL